MRATIINCSLKASPEKSNTEALAAIVAEAFGERGVETETLRAADLELKPGVESDLGDGDQWPSVREKLVGSEILVIASPTWLGRPSSIAQRVLERMNGMLGETGEDGLPIAYNRVAGVVVTGNEDGAHHVISEICGALGDIGYTIPAQAWTYWNKGPGPGDEYLEADDDEGKDWSRTTGRTAVQNLISVARALASNPLAAPATD